MKLHNYNVGDKIKFQSEKQRYKVIGTTDRYVVCMKPMNALRTYLYTIIDFVEKERGPDHWLWGKYFLTDEEDLQLCLKELESGECKLSPRRSIPLDIEETNENNR